MVGAEAELAAELNLDAGQIPLELWERPAELRAKTDTLEHRAITGLPANTGVNLGFDLTRDFRAKCDPHARRRNATSPDRHIRDRRRSPRFGDRGRRGQGRRD